MAQLIQGGAMMFDSLLYGQPHPNTQNFLARQFESLSHNLQGASQDFVQRASEMYERLAGSDAMRMMRAAGRTIRAAWQVNEIRPLYTMGDFQQAPLVMQRWLMAEPTARKLWQEQKIEGYADYVDLQPGVRGADHYDFRRVDNGIVHLVETDDEEGSTWHATTYFEDLLENDTDFTLEEQVDLQTSWDVYREHLRRRREDPTSRMNNEMG